MSRVLCVEPDSLLAQQYAQVLRKIDGVSDVTLAHDAQTALEKLDDATDCIVLELLLGQHNGLELLYEMRSHEDLHLIPVVLVTDISAQVLKSSMSYDLLGVYRHLPKSSMRLAQLCSAVEQAIEYRQSRQGLPAEGHDEASR